MSVQAKKHRSLSESLKLRVWGRDDYTCRYCGDELRENRSNRHMDGRPTVDHVIPTAQGGSGDLDNLVTACSPCNTAKHNQTPDQWFTRICAKFDFEDTRL